MNADIAALLVDSVTGASKVTFLSGASGGGGGLVGVELLVGVVDEILFGRHVDGDGRSRLERWLGMSRFKESKVESEGEK